MLCHLCFSLVYGGTVSGGRFKRAVFPAKTWNDGYVKEAVKKLLIPLIAGIFTVVAALTYYADRWHNGYAGNFFSHYRIFVTRITDLTGYDGGFTPGHLWFLLYLFLISMLALVVSKLQEKFLKQVHWNTPSVWKVWLFGLLPVIGKPVLDIGGKSIGAYLMFFLIGYYVFYREDVTGFLKKYFPLHLVIFLIGRSFQCLSVLLLQRSACGYEYGVHVCGAVVWNPYCGWILCKNF